MTIDVTGYTAAKTQALMDEQIIDAALSGDNLILTTRGGSDIDVGNVRGPMGGRTGGTGPKNARGVFCDHYFDDSVAGAGFYVRDIIMRVHDAPASTADPPYDVDTDAGYFFANQYSYQGGINGAYIGLQTSTRRFVWSVWESPVAAVAENVMITGTRPSGLTVEATSFSGEGVGKSLLVHHGWLVGENYRMRLYDAGDLSSDGTKWFRFYLAKVQDDLTTVVWELQVGRIKNAPGQGLLASVGLGTWFESYLGARARPEDFPYMSVSWLQIQGNPLDGHHFPVRRDINWSTDSDTWPNTDLQVGFGKVRIETGKLSM